MDTIFKDLDNILAFKVRYCRPGQEEPAYYRFYLHKNYYLKIIKALDKLAEKCFYKSKEIVELTKYDVNVDNTKLYQFLDITNNSILKFRKYLDINNHEVLGKNKDIIKIKLREFNEYMNSIRDRSNKLQSLRINHEYTNNYNSLTDELMDIIDKYINYIQKIIDIEFKDDRYQMLKD